MINIDQNGGYLSAKRFSSAMYLEFWQRFNWL